MKLSHFKISTQLILIFASIVLIVSLSFLGFSIYSLRIVKQAATDSMHAVEMELATSAKDIDSIMTKDIEAVIERIGTLMTFDSDNTGHEKMLKDLHEIKMMLHDLNTDSSLHITAMIDEVKKTDESARQTLANDNIWARNVMVGFTLSIVVLACPSAFLFGLSFSRPIRKGIGLLQSVTERGDLSVHMPTSLLLRADEIGDLGQGIKAILQNNIKIAEMATNLADGDWTHIIKAKSEQDVLDLSLEKMVSQINQVLNEINGSVVRVVIGSSEVASAAQSLSDGAQTMAASMEQIAASMHEISDQTKKNAENAGLARDLSQQANNTARVGQDAMKEMITAMDHITFNSNEIQRVIKVIDDIAFQTNLLALNAAVEAARAGPHGKGFAVVAEEVRNLAARSAKATHETSDLIVKNSLEVKKGAEVVARTAEALNMIVGQIKQTSDIVMDIATANNEQAHGVGQVTIGLQQIDSVTQQNTAAAEQSASAANEMSNMAANLQKLVGLFKLRE